MEFKHMESTQRKPKLAFFQYKYDEKLPAFLLMHKQDHVSCLSQFFTVLLFNEDCDYKAICEEHQPEIALFESGVNHRTCRRPEITNIHAYPEIPKLGFHNADAWCEARAGFISDMDQWGIETFFAICTTASEHMPDLGEKLFVWPNFINPVLYRDYGERKIIPVLFTGNTNSLYPWRRRVYKLVEQYHPTLTSPHLGYGIYATKGQVIYGERYARTINASYVVPSCGTIAKEVVRKHFEIPGCKACLVTERSPGLEAAGFVDMENCVFTDEGNVLDKLDYLFGNQEVLERITDAGHQLVHSRHTLRQRNQIFQWFELHKNLQPGQRIVQGNPFEPLTVVEEASGIRNAPLIANGLHLQLLYQGDEKLWAGEYQQAERLYMRCVNHIPWMPEAKFRVALCKLYQGDAKTALRWLSGQIRYILAEYKAIDPDPVEWAYYIVCLLCLGKMDDAKKRASEFTWLRHSELDRARWAVNALTGNGSESLLLPTVDVRHRCSLHRLPLRNLVEWVGQLSIVFKACQQVRLAKGVIKYSSQASLSRRENPETVSSNREMMTQEIEDQSRSGWKRGPFLRWGKRDALSFFKRQLLSSKLQSKVERRLARLFHRVEARFGYFLPYNMSAMQKDDFFAAIRKLVREENIKTAIIIGAAMGEGTTEAFLAGINENENEPVVFCLNGLTRRFARLQKGFVNSSTVKCYEVPAVRLGQFAEEVTKVVKKIREENEIGCFDAVLIDDSTLRHPLTTGNSLDRELDGARILFLDDINASYNCEKHYRMLTECHYRTVDESPCLRNGFAIFKMNAGESSKGSEWSDICGREKDCGL